MYDVTNGERGLAGPMVGVPGVGRPRDRAGGRGRALMARRRPTPPRQGHGRALTNAETGLLSRVLEIVEAARGHAARSVNSAMVHAYWMIGREIVVTEQAGIERAGYGDEVIERLAERLTRRL